MEAVEVPCSEVGIVIDGPFTESLGFIAGDLDDLDVPTKAVVHLTDPHSKRENYSTKREWEYM